MYTSQITAYKVNSIKVAIIVTFKLSKCNKGVLAVKQWTGTKLTELKKLCLAQCLGAMHECAKCTVNKYFYSSMFGIS